MRSRIKLLATLALAGVCGALSLPSVASAAHTGVTIHLYRSGLKGFVFSPKPGQCAVARTVELYRQKGKGQHPKRDVKVAKTVTESYTRNRGKWTLPTTVLRPGDFYARVPRTAHCQADNSKTLDVSKRPNTTITHMSITHRSNVTFNYRASHGIPPYGFQCKLDDKPYRHCPPLKQRYVGLSHGRHVFKVRARGSNGKQDRTPDRRGFRIHGKQVRSVQRRLTFIATDLGNMEQWKGKLIARHSRFAKCVAGRPVSIEKKLGGGWTPYDKIHTGEAVGPPKPATARYQGDQEVEPGVYRARARRSTIGNTVCEKTTSERQKVNQ
jgi:hypothetical protein